MIVGKVVGKAIPAGRGILLTVEAKSIDGRVCPPDDVYPLRVVRNNVSMSIDLGDALHFAKEGVAWFPNDANMAQNVPLTRLQLDDASTVGPESLR